VIQILKCSIADSVSFIEKSTTQSKLERVCVCEITLQSYTIATMSQRADLVSFLKGRKLLVIGTTSQRKLLQELEFMDVFNAVLSVPSVCGGTEVRKVLEELGGFSKQDLDIIESTFQGTIPIKKLIMIAEMALQLKTTDSLAKRFVQCMQDYGLPTTFINTT
jgi:hypothetical protein